MHVRPAGITGQGFIQHFLSIPSRALASYHEHSPQQRLFLKAPNGDLMPYVWG